MDAPAATYRLHLLRFADTAKRFNNGVGLVLADVYLAKVIMTRQDGGTGGQRSGDRGADVLSLAQGVCRSAGGPGKAPLGFCFFATFRPSRRRVFSTLSLPTCQPSRYGRMHNADDPDLEVFRVIQRQPVQAQLISPHDFRVPVSAARTSHR